MSRIGVLGGSRLTDYESAARALKVQILSLEVRGPNPDFEGAFLVATRGV